MSCEQYHEDGAHLSSSASTPAAPDSKNLPENNSVVPATSGEEIGNGDLDRLFHDGSIMITDDRRARGAEVLSAHTSRETSTDDVSGGTQAVARRLPRHGFRAEGAAESSASAVKEEGRAATPVTGDEREEQRKEHRGAPDLDAARGRGEEEGLSATGDKERIWRQRQALLRKYLLSVVTQKNFT